MSAHHFAAIAKNTGRIADCLEQFLADSRKAQEVDVEAVIKQAMNAVKESNPAFKLAFEEMERRVEAGQQPPVIEAGD